MGGVCWRNGCSWLHDFNMLEAEAVEQCSDRGAGVLAGSVEDAVAEGVFLELILSVGTGFGLEILVGGGEQAGGTSVDAGVLVVDGGDEEFGGGEGNVDGLVVDVDIFGPELGEVDTCDGLAMNDEQDAVAGKKIGQDGAGLRAFDDGVERIDDGFEAAEALDLLDDGGNRGIEGGRGASADGGGNAGENAGSSVAEEDNHTCGTEEQGEDEGDEGSGRAAG